MSVLLVSPKALILNGKPNLDLIEVLKKISEESPVIVVSNHPEVSWFNGAFNGTGIVFRQEVGRQSGHVVRGIAAEYEQEAHNVVVLASSIEDVQMGKNGGAILIAANWSPNSKIAHLGIAANSPAEFLHTITLLNEWEGKWWFTAVHDLYSVFSLANLSGYNVTIDQQNFADKLTAIVKNGGPKLNALLAITARSLLSCEVESIPDLMWGVYPSSSSRNNDSDVLCDFTHRLRTTVSKVRFCKVGQPLFIRHKSSLKRSHSKTSDRRDPQNQIETLHINPFYRNKIDGRNIIIMDDCTTYGLSFGVAAAFLKAANAVSVTGIALGKFGNQLRHYDIVVNSDPFSPVTSNDYTVQKVFEADSNKHPEFNAQLIKLLDD